MTDTSQDAAGSIRDSGISVGDSLTATFIIDLSRPGFYTQNNHTAKGLDIVAAYSDYSARYYNPSGTGVIWDAREKEMDQLIFDLLRVGFEITKRIGIGLRDMLPVPQQGHIRIFIMAYDGSAVGEGLYDQLNKDSMGNIAITTGSRLMSALNTKHKNKDSVAHYTS